MYNSKTFLAVIPARGGSKGIPGKNIIDFLGKPLIAHSIDAAMKSKYVDKVIVNTDDNKISSISTSYGADVIIRPKELASDTSPTIDVLLHTLSLLDIEYDAVVLLQPTSPLRREIHIDKAIEMYDKSGLSSLASICPVEKSPLLVRSISLDGKLMPLLQSRSDMRRQDMPSFYQVNGAIYINDISKLHKHSSLNDNEVGYVMTRESSIDIDVISDLHLAEALYHYAFT